MEAADRPGLGARINYALATAPLNLQDFSAMAPGRRAVIYLTFDSRELSKATQVLKSL